MGLHKDSDENHNGYDFNYDDDVEEVSHKKQIKRLLEDRLERKRLKEELEYFDGELDGEFDWEHFEDIDR